MEYIGFIYEWTNTTNGMKYIGSHKGTIDDGYIGSGKRFMEDYNPNTFTRTILEYVVEEDILEREQYWLDKTNAAKDNTYYNVRAKSGGGFEHINSNPVLRQKSLDGVRKWYAENEHPKGMLGKKQSKESNEVRRKKSKELMAEKQIPVYQFDYDGKLVKRHESISDAAKSVGGNPSNIKYTCDGKFTNAHGFLWSYDENPPELNKKPDQLRGKKKIQTPDGIFETVSKVVEHYGFTSTTQVRRRCLSEKHEGWKYL